MTSWNIENHPLSQILTEHQCLGRSLIQLQRLFVPNPLDDAFEKTRNEVLPKLREIRSFLEEHFHREEDGGYLEDAACKLPSMGRQVDRIIEEHPVLLERLDRIIQILSAPVITATEWHEAHTQFAAYIRQQREHEHRENEIIQHGFNEDFGAFLD